MHCSLRLSILLLATWVSASPHSAASVVRVAASPPVKSVLALPDTLSADDVEAFGGHLGETTVRAKRRGLYRSFDSMENSHTISLHELTRAACCNLGESFVTNPSVDVNYSDAATGARQIRLLGLAGNYVQMLTENIPNFRILSLPYGLGFVPGPWMQSIQVSKGASSVKNGYEAITGQINLDYKKPHQLYPHLLSVNGYADWRGRLEANVESTLKPSARWGTTLLAHYDKNTTAHDGNHDGLADMPKTEQLNLLNRWTYEGERMLSQFGMSGLAERRRGGQIVERHSSTAEAPYRIGIDTRRLEGFGKTAYFLDDGRTTNIAVMLSGSVHDQEAAYGKRDYAVTQTNGYFSLLFETQWTKVHALSIGASLNHDLLDRRRLPEGAALANGGGIARRTEETVPGVYAQYTFDLDGRITMMGGLRVDHSTLYGTFLTPRAHLKFTPSRAVVLRLTAGKGSRTAHVLEENNFLLAGSRRAELENEHLREEAWNYGASLGLRLPVFERMLNANVEYYYTDFSRQAVIDFDSSPSLVRFHGLKGRSYSSVLQAEVSYPFFEGFNLTAAYRLTDVRTTYDLPTGATLLRKPLQGRYKAMVTATYATPLDRWQFDLTLQVNGGGRMPESYDRGDGMAAWAPTYAAYPRLSAQITRNFRRWSIYVGGENLTGHRQKNAIIDAAHPWGNRFDPTMVYAPLDGAMAYLGFRYTIAR